MPLAQCLIRPLPCYRRDAFERGLKTAGYSLISGGHPKSPEDLLVVWNRYGQFHAMANAWEQRGGTVLVTENGYIGKDKDGHQLYAISADGHNGSGWWPFDESEDRWSPLGIALEPWVDRPDGYVLVCGQRGIGSPTMASPSNWHVNAAAYVAQWHTNVRIRLHPGRHVPTVPLETDLGGARYCVIWSSGSGVKALTMGIPVFYDAPYWICAGAAKALRPPDWTAVSADAPRLAALRKMAHAQWRVDEIASGEPFMRFRAEITNRRKVAA